MRHRGYLNSNCPNHINLEDEYWIVYDHLTVDGERFDCIHKEGVTKKEAMAIIDEWFKKRNKTCCHCKNTSVITLSNGDSYCEKHYEEDGIYVAAQLQNN